MWAWCLSAVELNCMVAKCNCFSGNWMDECVSVGGQIYFMLFFSGNWIDEFVSVGGNFSQMYLMYVTPFAILDSAI